MVEFSSSSWGNQSHKVDSPFNEDSKNITFSREALIWGKGRPENVRKMSIFYMQGHLLLFKSGSGQFQKRILASTPGYKLLVMLQFSYMPDQILGKKMRKLNFQAKI